MIDVLLRWRYRLLFGFFTLWMLLFDSNNAYYRYQTYQEIKRLEEQEDYYEKEIRRARQEREDLFGDQRNLERFAREKYLMKKDNEDIFILVEPEKR
jgi:cell division protein DivIC